MSGLITSGIVTGTGIICLLLVLSRYIHTRQPVYLSVLLPVAWVTGLYLYVFLVLGGAANVQLAFYARMGTWLLLVGILVLILTCPPDTPRRGDPPPRHGD